MKKIIVTMCLLGLVACYTPQDNVNRLIYLKDTRTNLCFTGFGIGSQNSVFTYIPCTDAVEKAIVEDHIAAQSVMQSAR